LKDVTVGKVKFLKKIELAYIAGFLDGDGTVISLVEKHREKKYGLRIRVLVEFTQHDQNLMILKFLKSKIGEGNINKSLRNVWKYSIKDQKAVREILKLLEPFSLIKKRQIKFALKVLDLDLSKKQNLLKAARLSDKLSKLNLRSKSRKINGFNMARDLISRND